MRKGARSSLGAIAAATTPFVAAALLVLGVVAGGCGTDRPATAPGSAALENATPTAGTGAPGTLPAPPPAGRLVVVTGAPDRPHASVHDPGNPAADSADLTLPPDAVPLVALVAAPDGRLAAVTADGRTWTAGPLASPGTGAPGWRPRGDVSPAALPGPVLDAAWSRDGTTLLLLAGDPGSGIRRTAILHVPDAGSVVVAEVPFEANGPGFAAVADETVAMAGRDDLDREALVRVAVGGAFVATQARIRGVVAGGDLVAIVADEVVLVGTLADLDRGALPADPLPLADAAGIGRVAVAPDGTALAVVRLDADGDPDRIEILRRAGEGWEAAGMLPVPGGTPSVLVAWIP